MHEIKQKNWVGDCDERTGAGAAQRATRLGVAVVTETYPPELNGVSLTVNRAVDYLRGRGHSVEVVRPKQAADAGAADVEGEILVRGMGLPLYPGIQFGFPAKGRLQAHWRAAPPDVVHIATEGPLGWSALNAARTLDIPVTSDYRTHFSRYSGHYGVGWLAKPIESYLRHFHNRANATFVSTNALLTDLESRGYENVVQVGRGIDLELFSARRRSAELRATWGVREGGLAVLHVGRLAPEKNLGLAARAFDAIRDVRPDARMIWVGDGPQRARMQRAHADHVFMGIQRGERLAASYASADMFLFPSLTETFGNVTLEALASGLALVAFDEGAAAQHARDSISARLVPAGDQSAFVTAATGIAGSPELLQRLRGNAHAAVSAFTWPAVLSQFERHLVSVAHGSRLYANALVAS